MTDSTNHAPASKTPSHIAYHVRNREGGEGFWTRIGSAWSHKDGNGINIQLETLPIDGRITGQLLKMELIDHVVIGNGNRTSLRELGYFYS